MSAAWMVLNRSSATPTPSMLIRWGWNSASGASNRSPLIFTTRPSGSLQVEETHDKCLAENARNLSNPCSSAENTAGIKGMGNKIKTCLCANKSLILVQRALSPISPFNFSRQNDYLGSYQASKWRETVNCKMGSLPEFETGFQLDSNLWPL